MAKKYFLKPKKNRDLIIVGILLIIINTFILITSGKDYHSSVINVISAVFSILFFPLGIYYVVRSGIVAYKLNKPVLLWILISIFIFPLSFIMLGNKETNNMDKEFENIYRKYRDKYFSEIEKHKISYIKNEINKKQFSDIENEIIKRLENGMNKEIHNKIIKKEEHINKKPEKEVVIKGKKINYNNCPACGQKLSETDKECPECGLFIG